ncbi:hypothetical protein FAM09_29710 [Niastella caeni]|uniref:PA14 domain-containing protein n=1 Tax=Niastella caeni TaxID=2569763 RepID=A0A4S8H9Q3_9BACT|nr:hypothetical protein [Niastella caeni]THU30779.1 hypothetical protein FAM09_29710 [Niastella caeni]
MIQLLAAKFSKPIASVFFCMFLFTLFPVRSRAANRINLGVSGPLSIPGKKMEQPWYDRISKMKRPVTRKVAELQTIKAPITTAKVVADTKEDIGGPSQPEMSTFKSAGTGNMVNLFTGDFSYNIPLMDVGGYPINIFYNGGITMEQEASWVGLGWNINPGSINRNMRGVPDDFNGEDELYQTQRMKPNKTWGVSINGDLELVGIKKKAKAKGEADSTFNISVGASMGVSFNNYLGPALDLGVKGGASFKIAGKAGSEKSSLSMGAGIGANINSRGGLTISPNVSLTAGAFKNAKDLSFGVRLGTSYNSKSGIKDLTISDQMSHNYKAVACINNNEAALSHSRGASLLGTSISFAKPSYIPAVRMPLNNEAWATRFQIGGGIWGVYGSAEIEVYRQTSEEAIPLQRKPMVGYLYYQEAVNNPHAVMDFTRLNDNEVTPNTPIISAPQYTYDVFSIQGEGTGGTIRAYRNDLGYVRDNITTSREKNVSSGGDVGIPGHYGGNFNLVKTPTVIGEWDNGNKLRQGLTFQKARQTVENVYFRNPGETTVLNAGQLSKIGGTDLVRFKLGGSNAKPTIEPELERFSASNSLVSTTSQLTNESMPRAKRTQVTTFLTAAEADVIGLDRSIKSYNSSTVLDGSNSLMYYTTSRFDLYRKRHHLSQITVTEDDGKRYVYGLPVYSIIQKDFIFSVNKSDGDSGRVEFTTGETTTLNNNKDGYLQVTQTPSYAQSFLLSGIISPDYVDISNDGITDDDLGTAIKFNYSQQSHYRWRTPLTSGTTPIAHFNAGNRTETKDDKGILSWGTRETWYLHSVESKTMIALFTLESRSDGKGSAHELSDVKANDNSLKRLKKIDLYSKADLKKYGLAGARPVKTVWFGYSYDLCAGTRDNTSGGGKLTLDSIWFTFNGQKSVKRSKYVFAYTNPGGGNPSYAINASDRWGNYKPASRNPGSLKNADYPYAVQDKGAADEDAAAWSLKKILLPSGAQLEVNYESDDYAYVQNRRACNMLTLAGLGHDSTTITDKLYGFGMLASPEVMSIMEHDYVFIQVPEPCSTKAQVYQKYLEGHQQLSFKIAVNMPKGMEYIPAYATIAGYGVYDATRIWVKMERVSGLSPLTLAALDFLRERLPGQAFPGYDVSESSGLRQIGEMLHGLLDGLKGAFKDLIKYLRSQGKAQTIQAANSFVRLNDADGFRYGGGHRVKSVTLKDNWQAMTGQFTSEYRQQYDYTTTEIFNGAVRTISSGVASYEPGIGSEENPFQSIVQVSDKLPLGPASYGAIEMPMLDAFFPAPLVGYSKVTVRSKKDNHGDSTKKSRSGIGKQVTEFYTAKDYPVFYQHTPIDPGSNKEEHKASLTKFFSKYAFDSRALSQGFLVATNDMHGKLKSQASYAEHDDNTRLNYTANFYRNTGARGLDDKYDFVSQGGAVTAGNMGIDVELMTDTREFSVKSTSFEIQGQVDMFVFIITVWLPFIWPVVSESEDTYRAVTTTKVINYHGVLDSVVVIDKGSQVSTKNLVYDAETGQLVVTRTNNEFDKPVYNVTYPAYWAYSGMGPASRNIDAVYTDINFDNGRLVTAGFDQSVFESGDELYVSDAGVDASNCGPSVIASKIWVLDLNKNNTALTVPVKDLVFMDENGNLINRNKVGFRIVRSGKRNMLTSQVAAVTLMNDPVPAATRKLTINSSSNVIQASAMECREKWQADNDMFKKLKLVFDEATCTASEIVDCNGYFEKNLNPYTKGMLGNFRTVLSRVFYGNRTETDPATATNLRLNGFLANFKLYWDFDAGNNLVPDADTLRWVWNEQATLFNSVGMELENKNALGHYTGAQYGYNKTLPIAIASNSRHNEMLYEGFEDYDYQAAVSGAPTTNPCAQRHLDLLNIPNSTIYNTDALPFSAHTGRYVLGVAAGKTASKEISVRSSVMEDYTLQFGTKTTDVLNEPGKNFIAFERDEPGPWPNGWDMQDGYFGDKMYDIMDLRIGRVPGNGYKAFVRKTQYFEAPQSGTYNLSLYAASGNFMFTAYTSAFITSIDGSYGKFFYTEPPPEAGSRNGGPGYMSGKGFQLNLCKGIYMIDVMYQVLDSEIPVIGEWPTPHLTFSYSLNGFFYPGYKKYSSLGGCSYTTPIYAKDSMLNPTFSIPAGKKMVFSAWVRETCGNADAGVPCADTAYTHNQVQLSFNTGGSGNVVLKPAGPVIEGWQRYEGYFTAPANATLMTMDLINSSSGTTYFDDIRIHPFNANMKSYAYDPVNLRLVAEMDANNYTTFYEYDEEGELIRTKIETKEGVKTINETRSSQQQRIKNF